jgi:hypothetical protein
VFRVVVDPSPFSPSFPFCFPSTATLNSSKFLDPSSLVERESDRLRSDARRTLGVASLSARVAKRCRSPSFLRDLSFTNHHHDLHCELVKALHMPWVPLYRSSIRVVDVNALQQQQPASFDGNAFSSSAIRRQRSSSSAIRLAL